jgi:D-3-phosphoglycerate dehydrogenase
MLPETKNLVGARELGLMKPTALRDGKIAGAASDVFAVEPATKDHPLLKLDNFITTPHMATHTEEALGRMSLVALDIIRVLEGKEPMYPVNKPRTKR